MICTCLPPKLDIGGRGEGMTTLLIHTTSITKVRPSATHHLCIIIIIHGTWHMANSTGTPWVHGSPLMQ